MKRVYSLVGLVLLILMFILPVFLTAQPTGFSATALYFLAPLAALSLALVGFRRGEPRPIAIGVMLLAVVYLFMVIFGWLTLWDPGTIVPDSCIASSPLRCDEVLLLQGTDSTVQFQFANAKDTAIDLRAAVAVVTIDSVFEPGICTVPLVVVQPQQTFTVSCIFSNASLAIGEKERGHFGLSLRDHRGDPLSAATTFIAAAR